MEIRINGLTKVFPGNPAKNIPDTVAVGDFNVQDVGLEAAIHSKSA